jgi:hypothetical protein
MPQQQQSSAPYDDTEIKQTMEELQAVQETHDSKIKSL